LGIDGIPQLSAFIGAPKAIAIWPSVGSSPKISERFRLLAVFTKALQIRIGTELYKTRPSVEQLVIGVALANNEVLRSVIRCITVYVMHWILGQQRLTECLFSNKHMNHYASSSIGAMMTYTANNRVFGGFYEPSIVSRAKSMRLS
jgi:hypothetical protein